MMKIQDKVSISVVEDGLMRVRRMSWIIVKPKMIRCMPAKIILIPTMLQALKLGMQNQIVLLAMCWVKKEIRVMMEIQDWVPILVVEDGRLSFGEYKDS